MCGHESYCSLSFAQQGGAHARATDVGYTYGEHSFTASDIVSAVHYIKPDSTTRQYVKAKRNTIAFHALILELKGDLGHKFFETYNDASEEELIFASIFQSGNSEAPPRVKSWLDKLRPTLKKNNY